RDKVRIGVSCAPPCTDRKLLEFAPHSFLRAPRLLGQVQSSRLREDRVPSASVRAGGRPPVGRYAARAIRSSARPAALPPPRRRSLVAVSGRPRGRRPTSARPPSPSAREN